MYKPVKGERGWYVSNEDGTHKIHIVGHGIPTQQRAKSLANTMNKGKQVAPRNRNKKRE